MDLLRPQDVFFLHVETRQIPQHVCGLAFLDPPATLRGLPRLDEVIESLSARLDEVPQFSKRLVDPLPGLARPVFVETGQFDLRRHVRRIVLPDQGGMKELIAFVEDVMSRPMDRSKPLWALYLIEGGDGLPPAILLQLHHAIADGLGALDVARVLMRAGPHAGLPKECRPRGAPDAGRVHLALWALGSQLWAPVRSAAQAIREGARAPGDLARRALKTAGGLLDLARAGTARPTPFNRPVKKGRRFAMTELDIGSVREIRLSRGGTTTDIVLATMAGAIRRFLQEGGCRLDADVLRAMVPMSLRGAHGRGAPGNWTTALSLPLPIGPMSPEDRLETIRRATARLKASGQPAAARFVMSLLGTLLPPWLHGMAARRMYQGRWFNVIISIIPGPVEPFELAGRPLAVAYPILPLTRGVGLAVGVVAWRGRLTFGLTADRRTVPDLDRLASAIQEAFAELAAATGPAPAREPDGWALSVQPDPV